MISLKLEGTEIGLEEHVLKDLVMSGLPDWLHSMANKDAMQKTVYLAIKGAAMLMLGQIRRMAAKQHVMLPEPPDDEDPIITLANMLLNYSVEFIEGQSADAIYHMEGDKIVITGVKIGNDVFDIETLKEVVTTPPPALEAAK